MRGNVNWMAARQASVSLAALRRRHPEALADLLRRPVRHRLLRQRARVPAARRLFAAARGDDADPRGLGGQPAHGRGPARLLRVPRRADGAVGRPGRDRASPTAARSARRSTATASARRATSSPPTTRSSWPRRPACCRSPRRTSSRKWRLQPGKMLLIDLDAGPHHLRRRDQGRRSAKATPTASGSERTQIVLEDLPAAATQAPTSSNLSLLDRQQAFGYTQEDLQAPDDADGDHGPGSRRLDGHRHADLGALATSRSCSTPTSSRTSPRSPTRRSTRSARSW